MVLPKGTELLTTPANWCKQQLILIMFPITYLLCRPGAPWDTTEAYVFNACAFTKYHVQLALALKLYVTDRDNNGATLSDEIISEFLTDLTQNTEKMDCSNLKAQVEEEHSELLREVEERVERWTADAEELYHKWYLKTHASSEIPEASS